ncbi:hypothetical protein GcC1_132011 [Golovinomyces cichoracearum]|uniref:Uncharacterized protein n=1 Tax=Golovinomyces cichoracearum TaxID=62708 RepID=A0A420I3Q6_9PEZI|nr:hypothetical protein GcC1_132011 [Golovinomyces cichoracearum]
MELDRKRKELILHFEVLLKRTDVDPQSRQILALYLTILRLSSLDKLPYQKIPDLKPIKEFQEERLPEATSNCGRVLPSQLSMGNDLYPLQMDSLISKSENMLRVEKPIRVRILRFCHKCNTTFGRDKQCTVCQHLVCKQCARHPSEKKKTRNFHPQDSDVLIEKETNNSRRLNQKISIIAFSKKRSERREG